MRDGGGCLLDFKGQLFKIIINNYASKVFPTFLAIFKNRLTLSGKLFIKSYYSHFISNIL